MNEFEVGSVTIPITRYLELKELAKHSRDLEELQEEQTIKERLVAEMLKREQTLKLIIKETGRMTEITPSIPTSVIREIIGWPNFDFNKWYESEVNNE